MIQRLICTYRAAYGGVPSKVWMISAVVLVSRSGTMVIPFLSLYFTKELGFSPTQIGWLLGIYGIGGIAAGLIGGQLTHRIGAIPTMLFSLALTVPGFLILGQVHDFASVATGLFYLSVVAESIRPASVTATVDFCPSASQHAKALAVNRLAVNLGMTIGPALGGVLATIDFALLFYVNAATCAGALVCLFWLFGTAGWSKTKSPDQPLAAANSPWRDGSFLTFALLSMLASTVFFQLMGTFPLYLEQYYRMREYHIGVLFAINTVIIVLFELIFINYVKRFSLLRTVAWGQLLSCIGFGILPLAVGAPFGIGLSYCALTIVIWTLGEMLAMPLGAAYVAQRSNASNRGRYMGLYVTSFSIAAVVGPVAGMWIYGVNPHALWFFALTVGGFVFFGLLKLADHEVQQGDAKKPPLETTLGDKPG